jgi:hypothetical protein
MFTGYLPEVGHQLPRGFEAADVPELCMQDDRRELIDPAQGD